MKLILCKTYEELSSAAADEISVLERDVQAIFSIFAADPLVTCSYEDAKKLFKEMVDNTKEYLGGYDFSVLD